MGNMIESAYGSKRLGGRLAGTLTRRLLRFKGRIAAARPCLCAMRLTMCLKGFRVVSTPSSLVASESTDGDALNYCESLRASSGTP